MKIKIFMENIGIFSIKMISIFLKQDIIAILGNKLY